MRAQAQAQREAQAKAQREASAQALAKAAREPAVESNHAVSTAATDDTSTSSAGPSGEDELFEQQRHIDSMSPTSIQARDVPDSQRPGQGTPSRPAAIQHFPVRAARVESDSDSDLDDQLGGELEVSEETFVEGSDGRPTTAQRGRTQRPTTAGFADGESRAEPADRETSSRRYSDFDLPADEDRAPPPAANARIKISRSRSKDSESAAPRQWHTTPMDSTADSESTNEHAAIERSPPTAYDRRSHSVSLRPPLITSSAEQWARCYRRRQLEHRCRQLSSRTENAPSRLVAKLRQKPCSSLAPSPARWRWISPPVPLHGGERAASRLAMRRRRDRCRSHWATTAQAQGPPASQCNAPTVGRRRVARHLPRSRPRLPWRCHQSNRSRSRPRRDRCRLRLRHISRTRSRPRTRAQRGPPRRRKRSLPTIRVMRMGCCFRNARPRGRRYAATLHPKTVASFHKEILRSHHRTPCISTCRQGILSARLPPRIIRTPVALELASDP